MLEDIPTVNKMLWENVHPHSNKEMKIELFKNDRKKKSVGEDGCEMDRFSILLVVCNPFGEQCSATYKRMPYP